jgi:hypothetical protein
VCSRLPGASSVNPLGLRGQQGEQDEHGEHEGVLYLIVLLGGGLLVGLAFRWWGLFASVGFACFLAYAWEFYSPAVAYAVIAGLFLHAE